MIRGRTIGEIIVGTIALIVLFSFFGHWGDKYIGIDTLHQFAKGLANLVTGA